MITGKAIKDVYRPRCSIIIRAYNEHKHIGRLLAGIAQQTMADKDNPADKAASAGIETILVDSGSTDGTTTVAAQFPVQILHIPPDEFTFGRSLNLGISHAHSEFIVIASAHVHPVYPDWVERLIAPFQDSKVGLTYGKQRGNATTKFSEQQVFAHWYPEQSHQRQTHPFCNNANAAIRRSLWEGRPYDETLTGLEDLDWAQWIMQQGYTISYIAEAEVIHAHAEIPKSIYNRYLREAMAFKRIFPHERFGLADCIRLVCSNIANDLWHAARQGALLPNLGSIFWFRWMQFWGTYQGYRHPGPVTEQLRKTFYYPINQTIQRPDQPRDVSPISYED
jgi:rhamnosyltransferase